jgi:hypothetical protein
MTNNAIVTGTGGDFGSGRRSGSGGVVADDIGPSIEIRVEKIAQLFDAFDPLPYPHRDLAKPAEEFIVGWARELPHSQPISITVHIPAGEDEAAAARHLRDAFSYYFKSRADRLNLDIRELFRIGRLSLVIGIAVLAVCVIVGQSLARQFGDGYVSRFFNEGLIILGWVANWRPMEIFLYQWWPLVRQRNLYRRLSAANVSCRTYDPGQAAVSMSFRTEADRPVDAAARRQ